MRTGNLAINKAFITFIGVKIEDNLSNNGVFQNFWNRSWPVGIEREKTRGRKSYKGKFLPSPTHRPPKHPSPFPLSLQTPSPSYAC